MRRQYLALAVDRLRRADPIWLLRGAARYLTAKRGTRRGRPYFGPVFASLVVNYRCNLACAFCDAWRSAGGPRPGRLLVEDEWRSVLDDLARLGTLGVGITGGEPLLRSDCEWLIREIRTRGMLPHLNTNGTLLDDERASSVVAAGVQSVNVSIDAPDAAGHDAIRGRPRAFDAATSGIKALLRARGRNRSPRVTMVSVVDPSTDLEGLDALAGELGCDSIGFIPRHGFGKGDAAGASRDIARATAESLARLAARSARVDNSRAYIASFEQALAGMPSEVTCHVGVSHLVVDCHGDLFDCMPHNEEGRAIANLRDLPISSYWGGPAHEKQIRSTSACRDCHWNCHAEMNLLLERGGARS